MRGARVLCVQAVDKWRGMHPSILSAPCVSQRASEREAFLLPQGRYSTLAGSVSIPSLSLSLIASLFVFTRTTHSPRAEKLGA
jgi:hypothetical protein